MKIYTTKKLMEKKKWNKKHLTNPKPTRKSIKEQKLCGTNRKQTAKKGNIKLKYISNCIKCNWTKHYTSKAETIGLD